jgi:hypothetical protein
VKEAQALRRLQMMIAGTVVAGIYARRIPQPVPIFDS